MMKTLGIAAAILFLVIAMLFLAGLDSAWAMSLRPGFYPFALLPVLLVALFGWRERPIQIAVLVYLAILISLPFVSLSPVKPFTRFFSALQTGMNEADVLATLGKHFPEGGTFRRPVHGRSDDGGLWFQLDPDDGAYNAEFVMIEMTNGSVTSKKYLPD